MLSLKACLEEVARLGPGYVVNECGYEWEACVLLANFAATFPHELEGQVHFLRPGRYGDGAIYEDGSRGEMRSAVPLYRVEQQRVAVRSRQGVDHLGVFGNSTADHPANLSRYPTDHLSNTIGNAGRSPDLSTPVAQGSGRSANRGAAQGFYHRSYR